MADLQALFAQHRTAVLGTAAAAVAGLALMQRRKTTTGSGGGATAGATVPGTSPAAGVVPGGYDSSTTDLYNALSPQLEAILQTTGGGITAAPDPIASSLFSPSYDGQYVRAGANNGGNGPGIFEVEGDGSLLHLTQSQWDTAITKAGLTPNTPGAAGLFTDLSKGWNGSWYNTDTNIGAASNRVKPGAVTLNPSTGQVVSATSGS